MDNNASRSEDLPKGLFNQLSAAVESPLNGYKEALRSLLESANDGLQCQVATILTPVNDEALQFYESTDEVFVAEDFPTIPIGSSIAGFVFLSGQSMGMDDARQSTHFYSEIDDRSGFQTKEYLANPIVIGSNVIGVLTFANRRKQAENSMFSNEELALADNYASVCALILDHLSHIQRQTEATLGALRGTFKEQPDAAASIDDLWKATDYVARKEEVYAQLSEITRELSEQDLEILRDLADRLSLLEK